MGKYFTVTVKPEIAASKQDDGAFADGDLVFDWTAFNIPKGPAKLLNIQALIRGTDGSAQSAAFAFYFAKTIDGVAPDSLGTIHGTVNGTGYYNNLIGSAMMEENDLQHNLDTMALGATRFDTRQGGPNIVLQGEPDSGINVGYDKLYIGASTIDGDLNFSTNALTTGAHDVSELSTTEIGSLDDGSGGTAVCAKKFAVGDIVHATDDIILGQVVTVAANALTFKHNGDGGGGDNSTKASKIFHANGETLYTVPADLSAWKTQNGAAAAGDLANNDELFNLHPITLILQFER